MSTWHLLGIKRTRDRVGIARAYADRLAEIDPETQPGRADDLCAAYRRAHRFCDAMDSGPVTRIAPRRPGRKIAVQQKVRRPRRTSPARAQEVSRAVESLTRSIVASLARGDRRSAIAGLHGLFRDPLFGNQGLRGLVEQRLLEDVGALNEVSPEFCTAAVSAFGWDNDPVHLPPQSRDLADRLCAIVESERWIAGLRRLARRWAVRMWFDRKTLAAAMLTGTYRPTLFRLARIDPLTVRAVKSLLKDIHTHDANLAARTLDRRVISWWDEALGVTATPPPRSERAA